jgi:hypothetical protein
VCPPSSPTTPRPIRLWVVAITESWLNDEIINQLVVINGYNIFLKDRTHGCGGGVCAFVSADISYVNEDRILKTLPLNVCGLGLDHRQSRRQGLETPNVLRVPSVMRLRHACACAILNRLLLPKSKTNKRLILIYCLLYLYSSLYWKIVQIIYTENRVRYITLCVKFIKRICLISRDECKEYSSLFENFDFQFGVDFQARFRFVCVF